MVLPPPSSGPGSRPAAIVVVDPISTGVVLCYQAVRMRGAQIIAVWSDVIPAELKDYVDPRFGVEQVARIQHKTGALEETVAAVRALDFDVREVMVGCETGVLLNDELAEALGCRGNGTAKSSLRRNKWLQTEAIRSAGLNACGQRLADSAEDVESFLREDASNRTGDRSAHAIVHPSTPDVLKHWCCCAHRCAQLQGGCEARRGRRLGRGVHLRLAR